MPDAALSVGPSSSLAALLSGANADSTASAGKAASGTDPFAALLANATGPKAPASPGKAGPVDTLAALLASAAPVVDVAPVASGEQLTGAAPATGGTPVSLPHAVAKPVAFPPATTDPVGDAVDADLDPTTLLAVPVAASPIQTRPAATPVPVKAVRAAALMPSAPVAAEIMSVETDAAATAPNDKSGDKDDLPGRPSDSQDPLGDAIASGATAVLAFAPAIAPPIAPHTEVRTPVPTPVRIDAPIAAKPLKLPAPTAVVAPALSKAQPPAAGSDGSSDQAAAQLDPGSSQADDDARQRPAPTAQAKPAATQLPPEVAKAVTDALKQKGVAPLAAADPTVAPDATPVATAAKPPIEPQPQQPAAKRPEQQPAPVQTQASARRRNDEAPAPRRASDARKRVDPAPADAVAAATIEQAAGTPRTGFALGANAVAKGDTIVEQTLTIAKDGAWLDRLARDIAGAGSGNDLHFKLNPQNLGALSVAISQKDDGASIRLTADNQTTRDILVDAQPKLIAEARAHGLRVSDTQVDVRQDDKQQQNQSNSQESHRWAQNQNGQSGQQAQTGQNGQNRQSSPEHKPFVSNLGRKANEESESPERDSDALYA